MDMNWLKKYVHEFPELETVTGASGYFSKPQLVLDPQLFDGDHLKSDVRQTILDLFYNYMDTRYRNAREWSMAWLAGSGISYQWAADRGNGDLDVLFGIDYTKFSSSNPEFSGLDRWTVTSLMDMDLKLNLWPKTQLITFHRGDHPYEVTYYLNYDTENEDDSIKDIMPYAAYNLTEDHWTVDPIVVPDDPTTFYPAEFEEQARSNKDMADALAGRYESLRSQLAMTMTNTPQWHNSSAQMKNIVQEARNLFDQIHLGRSNAFTVGGQGYKDFFNYQWQAAKRDGVVQKLKQIAVIGETAQAEMEKELYGAPVEADSRILLYNAARAQGMR